MGACGLWDNQDVAPGAGYTGHCFADFNHVDCCTMVWAEDCKHKNNDPGLKAPPVSKFDCEKGYTSRQRFQLEPGF